MATNPTLLSRLLCADADKNTIPDTDAGTAGVFSQQYGWQTINSLPLSAGGKAVQRKDFNGVFNLLGGISFYVQKGWQFEFDETQNYYAGCIVRDTVDGKLYECLNDVSASSTHPNADSTNWKEFGDTTGMLTREVTPAFNTRDVITTSGTYTAPVTGWYKITVKGGGGGGSASGTQGTRYMGGGGGGEGGTTFAYVQMTAGDTATVVIGAGGAGGTGNLGIGTNGGNTSITLNGNTHIAYGGGGGGAYTNADTFAGGIGGNGTISGNSGIQSGRAMGDDQVGGTGGGTGGGICPSMTSKGLDAEANSGAGGAGGGGGSVIYAGGNGADGYVSFEYFATI